MKSAERTRIGKKESRASVGSDGTWGM